MPPHLDAAAGARAALVVTLTLGLLVLLGFPCLSLFYLGL